VTLTRTQGEVFVLSTFCIRSWRNRDLESRFAGKEKWTPEFMAVTLAVPLSFIAALPLLRACALSKPPAYGS